MNCRIFLTSLSLSGLGKNRTWIEWLLSFFDHTGNLIHLFPSYDILYIILFDEIFVEPDLEAEIEKVLDCTVVIKSATGGLGETESL